MAAPAYVDSGFEGAVAGTPVTMGYPTTVNANDIIICCVAYRGPSSVTIGTPTGGGWTAIQAQSGGIISQQRCYWKRAAGTEGGTTFDCPATGATLLLFGQCHRFSGCITSGNPYDGTAGALQENTGAGTTVTFEAMTLGGDDRLIVISYFEADDDITPGNFTTVDVTFTVRNDVATATGADGRLKLTTGPNGVGDTSISSTTATQPAADEYSIQQFALLPVGVAAAASLIPPPPATPPTFYVR